MDAIIVFLKATSSLWIPIGLLIVAYRLVWYWSEKTIRELQKDQPQVRPFSKEADRLLDLDEHEIHLS